MLLSTALTVFTVRFFFTVGEVNAVYIEVITAVLGLVCLILCDVVFKRFSRHYRDRIRKMLRIDKFLGD